MLRIRRGDASFAAKVLGSPGALLAVLAHFFQQDRWGSTATMSATMEIAKQVHSLAAKEGDPALMMGAYRALTDPLYFSGDFASARDYAIRAIQIWRWGVRSPRSKRSMCPWLLA
jgi:hypothetical protein